MKPGRCKFIFKPGNYDYLLFSIPKELFAKKISTAGFTYLQKKGDRFLSGVDLLPVLPISAATKKLIKQLQQADKTNEHIETNLMNVFLQLLAKYDTQSSNAEKNATIATEELADKAKEYILAMIKNGNSKSIPEIAELLGTTPSRMARAFKHKFHLTLKELIKEERMITARNLLSIKGTSPAMVSAYLGYSRISSLIREYKKRWGTWPQ
ncbi:hypothetical protein GCM10011379_21160 [Filimonas zeae]|uniref:HTH araC/xylS-type domain-containing protein n=2 Tax=Filimonas zeae TaxID=1737353 RepID=A0A917IYV0_9BACT|nr:hypothetical protein GCM10011379_21160 [Filimonas zeae]